MPIIQKYNPVSGRLDFINYQYSLMQIIQKYNPVSSNFDFVNVDSGTSTSKIYYNRPFLQDLPEYVTYDEGWMFNNNYDDPFYPIDGTLQLIDPDVSIDYLKYFNVFGHKFRFTGLNGGYYDFNDGNYYDVDGVLSTFQAEFSDPVGATSPQGYAIDHLTGLGFQTERSGTAIWATAISDVAASSLFGYTDWRIPPASWLYTLLRYDVDSALTTARLPFQWSQVTAWSCTTNNIATTSAFRLSSNSIEAAAKGVANGNRTHCRIHYTRNQFVTQP